MNSADLLALFRSDADDQFAPYLWSDEEVLSYLDDAQKKFCQLTGGIADATTKGVAILTARANRTMLPLHPRVLKVRAAFNAAGQALQILNFEDLEFKPGNKDLYSTETGEVAALVLGMTEDQIRLIKVPGEDTTINLITYRLPLEDVTASGQDLEIADQHHPALLFWMRHRAHLKNGEETFDPRRAEDFRQRFVAYCGQASDERGRREHKHRLVQFSW